MSIVGEVFGFVNKNRSGAQRRNDAASGERGAGKGARALAVPIWHPHRGRGAPSRPQPLLEATVHRFQAFKRVEQLEAGFAHLIRSGSKLLGAFDGKADTIHGQEKRLRTLIVRFPSRIQTRRSTCKRTRTQGNSRGCRELIAGSGDRPGRKRDSCRMEYFRPPRRRSPLGVPCLREP
jgi:hypothetical protein